MDHSSENVSTQWLCGQLADILRTSVIAVPPSHVHEVWSRSTSSPWLCGAAPPLCLLRWVPWRTRSLLWERFYLHGSVNGIDVASVEVIGGTPTNVLNTAPTHVHVNSGHVLLSLPRLHPWVCSNHVQVKLCSSKGTSTAIFLERPTSVSGNNHVRINWIVLPDSYDHRQMNDILLRPCSSTGTLTLNRQDRNFSLFVPTQLWLFLHIYKSLVFTRESNPIRKGLIVTTQPWY